MSDDDFPDVEEVLDEDAKPKRSRSRSTEKKPRAKKGRAKRARKEKPVTKTVQKIGQEAFDDDDDEPSPKKKSGGFWGDLLSDVGNEVKKELKKKLTPRQRSQRNREKKQIADSVGKKLLEIGKTPVGTLVKSGGALAAGSTAALVVIAGTAAYYGTTYIINRLAQAREAKKPSSVRFEAAMAYRQARMDAAAKLGRPLSSAEQKYLGQQFKAKLATIR